MKSILQGHINGYSFMAPSHPTTTQLYTSQHMLFLTPPRYTGMHCRIFLQTLPPSFIPGVLIFTPFAVG